MFYQYAERTMMDTSAKMYVNEKEDELVEFVEYISEYPEIERMEFLNSEVRINDEYYPNIYFKSPDFRVDSEGYIDLAKNGVDEEEFCDMVTLLFDEDLGTFSYDASKRKLSFGPDYFAGYNEILHLYWGNISKPVSGVIKDCPELEGYWMNYTLDDLLYYE